MLNFNIDAKDLRYIKQIADRATNLGIIVPGKYNYMTCMMDFEVVTTAVELDLRELVEDFDDYNFGHDVCGIARYLNRTTGKLEDGFSPRCSLN